MSNDNKISVVITPQQKTDALAGIAQAEANLPLTNLTPAEKRRLPTIGVERVGMVQVFDTLIAAHPDIVPSLVNLPEYDKDKAAWKEGHEILARITAGQMGHPDHRREGTCLLPRSCRSLSTFAAVVPAFSGIFSSPLRGLIEAGP